MKKNIQSWHTKFQSPSVSLVKRLGMTFGTSIRPAISKPATSILVRMAGCSDPASNPATGRTAATHPEQSSLINETPLALLESNVRHLTGRGGLNHINCTRIDVKQSVRPFGIRFHTNAPDHATSILEPGIGCSVRATDLLPRSLLAPISQLTEKISATD